MSNDADHMIADPGPMGPYEKQVWKALNAHWERRNNRRGLPNWASTAIVKAGDGARTALHRVETAVPDRVKEPIARAGEAAAEKVVRPAIGGAVALLDLVNDWALELNDPSAVEKLARKHGLEIDSYSELRHHDLKASDRLLAFNTLTWRSVGALEGGAMGVLALVPVAGIPVAMTADVLVIQVMSTSIAARIAYSYGYDAKDPEEQAFIERLVHRSFVTQAAKAEPLNEVARAAHAIAGRVRWSDKLRADHRVLVGLEKLLKHLGPSGARVPVQNVAKVVPLLGILIGAGMNSAVLAHVAADAQRYCQTRFLCEKYGMPLPAALTEEDEEEDEERPSGTEG